MNQLFNQLQAAMSAFQTGNVSQAEHLCQQILKQYSEQADALHILALIFKQKQQIQGADNFFIRSLKANNKHAVVHLNYANFLAQTGRLQQAQQSYQQTLKLSANNIDALYNYSLLLNQLGQYQQTIIVINQAIKLNEKISAFYNALASAYKNLGQFEQAIVSFKKAIALQSKDFFAWHNLGVLYRGNGEPKKALSCYQNILVTGENIPEFHFNLGCAYYDLGDFSQAEYALNKAIKLRPDYVMAHEAINNLFWENAEKDKFLTSYNLYLKSSSQPSEQMYFSFAAQLILSKKADEAIELLQKSLQLFGPQAKFCHALAVMYLKEGINLTQATELINSAIINEPNNTRFRVDMANILIKQQDYQAALIHLDFALKSSPLNQEVWAYKGICWRLLNDERELWLNNYEKFVGIQKITPPENFDNLEHFMFELKNFLTKLHNTTQQPLDQSVMGGSQTSGNLLLNSAPIIQQLKTAINNNAENYINSLPVDASHPFLSRKKDLFNFSGCWSVLLNKKGFHTNHVHPEGWLSGPTYISVPNDITPDDPLKSGWVKFGETSLELGDKEKIGLEHCPQAGDCVFFPSYMWHGTYPTISDSARITTPCDIQPRD